VGPFNTVSVIDTGSNAVVDSITIKNCRTIHDVERNCGSDNLAVSPDGSRLYVANYNDESIAVVDTATDTERYSIKLGDPNLLGDNHLPCEESNPDSIAVSPDGGILAISHSLADSCFRQPNFLWVLTGGFAERVTFSDSPIPVFSRMAIAAVPSGCAGGPVPCAGDCDGSGTVTVDELMTGVRIALGEQSYVNCLALDADHSGQVTVDELTRAVDTALNGCTAPTPTPVLLPVCPSNTPAPTPTPTPTLDQGAFTVGRPERCCPLCDRRAIDDARAARRRRRAVPPAALTEQCPPGRNDRVIGSANRQ
jgi:YVTN family beta-propeller protein